MNMRDLQNDPWWYRWFIYALAAAFIGVTIWFGFAGAFFGSVKSEPKGDLVRGNYGQLVDLEPLECKWTPESSFIERLCFHIDAEYAVVKMSGTYYQFCGLPPEVAVAWVKSDSLGRFFNQRIKGRYDCDR